ncbi:MAG: hypothetical protein SVW77_00040 [Candidatus Nanohaloarchaea archaeon]|nr:hypothetical protein [Candidatus Nanohaloarchaea archaeon]
MGGGPLEIVDYDRGRSAVRIADSHRDLLDGREDRYWRESVEWEAIRSVADRHDAQALYHAGDIGVDDPLSYLDGRGFDLVRFTPGDHDDVSAGSPVRRGTVVAEDVMDWTVADGAREYRVAMGHDPADKFNIRLETPASTDPALRDPTGDLYDLVIAGHVHFSRQDMLNDTTVVDYAGALGRDNHADGITVNRSFVDGMWNAFPSELQETVPPPERSLAVIRFFRGITIYRYDAEELARTYHDTGDIAGVQPDSVFHAPAGRDSRAESDKPLDEGHGVATPAAD